MPLASAAAGLPLMVWWSGWYPGFLSTDSIDQLGQLASGEINDHHPAFHTLFLGLLSFDGRLPGLVGLAQILILMALLGLAAYRLTAVGAPAWSVITAAWLVGLSPSVGPSMISLWKDVPFSLGLLWLWLEVLRLNPSSVGFRRWVAVGAAMAAVWLFRHNGNITVLPVLLVLGIRFRKEWRGPAVALGVMALVVVMVAGPLYAAFSVDRPTITPAETFLPHLAASLASRPGSFSSEDLALMEQAASLDHWQSAYSCYDSTPLLFDPAFNIAAVKAQSDRFWDLEVRVALRDPTAVAKHRVCSASFLFVPAQPRDASFHRPPYEIPPNTLGLARDPISQRAWSLTSSVFRWAEHPSVFWFTWRPAIVTLMGACIYALLVARRSPLAWSGVVPAAHVLNLLLTTPAQEFRYALPIYLIGLLCWPLALAVRSRSAEE